MLILGATPVVMLCWTVVQSWLGGKRREALTGLGVLLVLTASLWTVFAQI